MAYNKNTIINYENWESTCEEIVMKQLASWKNLNSLTNMLDHLPPEIANIYLQDLLKDNLSPHIINYLASLNDKYGDPIIHNFNFGISSSTINIRYIRHAFDICNLIKKKSINGPVRIIEVGAGYGGLCLILCELSKFLNVNISEYYIYDLPKVQSLQQYYLKNFDEVFSKISWKDCQTFGADIPEDINNILVSSYCISELSDDYRKNYLENILPKIKAGFLAWNNSSRDYLPSQRNEEFEKPQTGYHNVIITL